MKQLVCEMCGSKDLIKDGGVFVCQSCGCKYTVEEAKKMMIEGTVRVDNTHMIENYLSMANNAYRSSNNSEAENYCNKVIEIDPSNYQALMLKGKTAGWQSTLSNNRFEEAINCFSSAIDHAPDEEKEALTNEAVEEVKKLSLALTKLQGDRFEKWPDDEEAAGLLNVVVEIYKALIHFASNISTGVNKDEIMSPVAHIINNSVIGAWNNKAVPEYRQDSDGHPDKYAFSKLLNRGDYCLKLLEQANDLSDGDDSADITRLENMIAIQEFCINGCAYEYKTVATGTDIWDGSTIYGNRYVKTAELTDQAKTLRRKLISDYRNKISTIRSSIARKEAAEKAEKERKEKEEKQRKVEAYWQEHPEEKERLLAEKKELSQRKSSLQSESINTISPLSNQIQTLSAESNRISNEIEQRIIAANEELKRLGLFKTKEKKELRERIEQLTAEKNEAKKSFDERIASLNRDIERIKNETGDKTRQISNRISTIDRVLAEVWTSVPIYNVGDTTDLKSNSSLSRNSNSTGVAVNSPMPGEIRKISVKIGDKVQKDQKLMVLYSMFVDHDIIAPVAGVVESVSVFQGASVKSGSVLCTISQQAGSNNTSLHHDEVAFGRYTQKQNGESEPIKWQVLARERGCMLVVSKYALDSQKYNLSHESATWETSSLRKWLNETFLNAAFSPEEQKCIISSTVAADQNPSHSTSPGNNTLDKVFLLSITEVNHFLSSDEARVCTPTEHTIAKGTGKSKKTGGCWWWLRSPGSDSIQAAFVGPQGSVYSGGYFVDSNGGAVRPAMWIDLSAGN